MNTQYKKGVLELCVLALLHKRDCYGYEISEFLSQHIEIAGGTVYPILRKLKADGLLTTYLQEESGGPPRKYYKLAELGAAADVCLFVEHIYAVSNYLHAKLLLFLIKYVTLRSKYLKYLCISTTTPDLCLRAVACAACSRAACSTDS